MQIIKKIAYKDIRTREQLLGRVHNGKLSVGCFMSYIKKFLSNENQDGKVKVSVSYSTQHGITEKDFYI